MPLYPDRQFQMTPDRITIEDLEVWFHVGVPDSERTKPQRLLITIEMTRDLAASGASDNLEQTIDYYSVSEAIREIKEKYESKQIIESDKCYTVKWMKELNL